LALFPNDFQSKWPEKKLDFFAFNLPQFRLSAIGAQGLTKSGFGEKGVKSATIMQNAMWQSWGLGDPPSPRGSGAARCGEDIPFLTFNDKLAKEKTWQKRAFFSLILHGFLDDFCLICQ
jgi:hypothetical protein